ncbi:pyridoxamine 5'-phosphate oxidase family protein [Streptomyces ardesiacus]|uniref:pyridoxamine 5'-phosphate oxidase family protein n=1 Tax=unclassified Streptomyces TaxID=2593676 RepID=UPI0004C4FF31|nr:MULTISPECIES: pyridoxamine 5'-phosphate oxidase family protein [unclassified Streptomyces]
MTAASTPASNVTIVQLLPGEALALLASVKLGRVAFSHQALPAIRLVNHVVDEYGDIIVRTHSGAALLNTALMSEVVAYEADELNPDVRTGWSVVVTGTATWVSDTAELARYEVLLTPWVGQEMDQVVRIRPDIVTGYRLQRTTRS